MRIVKAVLLVVAALVTLSGLIWIGQGSGVFPYPAASFMINDPSWAYRGIGTALAGIVAIYFLRRK